MDILIDNLPSSSTQLNAILQAFPDLLFTLDESGTILDYKAGDAASLLFTPPKVFIGQRVEDALPRELAASLLNALQQIRKNRETISFEYSLGQADAERWFEARVVPSSQGQFFVVVRDATRHKQAEEKIKSQLKRMAALRAIDLAISSSLDLNLALSVVLSQVTAQLSVDAADILLLSPQNLLEFKTGVGFRTDALLHTSLQMGEGYAGMAALQQKIISVPDLQHGKTGFLRSPRFLSEGFHSYYGLPLIAKGRVRGVLEIFHRAPLRPDVDWLDFMETLAGQAAIAVDNSTLFNDLQKSNLELIQAYDVTLESWAKALELRDAETAGHCNHVTDLTLRLAREMGMSNDELVHVRRRSPKRQPFSSSRGRGWCPSQSPSSRATARW